MACKVIELQPNRNLLNSNFNGYKLSLDATPLLKEKLTLNPLVAVQSEEQYSHLHAELFGLQNLLVRDNWNTGCSYFIDIQWNVLKVEYDNASGKLKPIVKVFALKPEALSVPGCYNVSLWFISAEYSLLSDGKCNLFVLNTNNRNTNQTWKVVQKLNPMELNGFVIKYALMHDNSNQIEVILLHIEQENSVFYSILEWITLNAINGEFDIKANRRLKGRGSINYCYLEKNLNGLILSSEKPIEFTFDSVNPLKIESAHGQTKDAQTVKFTWNQTAKEIFIHFNQKEDANTFNFDIKCTNTNLNVKFENENLIDEKIYAEINSILVAKSWENGQLRLKLPKIEVGFWPYLFENGPMETDETAEPNILKNLESQMEECDYTVNGEDAEYYIERKATDSHIASHKINIGHIPLIFSFNQASPGELAAIVLRYDVDALVWIIEPSENIENWNLKHEGTLPAMGYVQASKQQKKFISCSPDLSYSVICEPQRYVFIYKNEYHTAFGLRNRSGQKHAIGQQKLIQLKSTGEIFGMVVENEVTILLTEQYVICMQIKTAE